MNFKVARYSDDGFSTQGLMFLNTFDLVSQFPRPKFLCHTIEDKYRSVKMMGETRIPAGRYKLALRTEGQKHEEYSQLFPKIHKGMIWLLNVPKFEYIYIHCGNTDKDTLGCILVGNTVNNNQIGDGAIGESRIAYSHIYPIIANAILKEESFIDVVDETIFN